MTEKLIRVPTLDGQNSCWADIKQTGRHLACFRINICDNNPSQCTSGFRQIWLKQDQLHDYYALKLVS